MIFTTNQIFGKIWKVTPAQNGKYIDFQMTTSEKDQDGNYKNSGWFPRAIGHAVNSLKGVKEGDRIVITKAKLTNERYEDEDGSTKSRFRFLILEATIQEDEGGAGNGEAPKATETPKKQQQEAESDDCPW